MIGRPPSWSEDQLDRLAAGYRAGRTMKEIGDELGVSRNAVTGKVNRLRRQGDARLPAKRRPSPIKQAEAAAKPRWPFRTHAAAALADRLAELVANGRPLESARAALLLTRQRADELWRNICRGLGEPT